VKPGTPPGARTRAVEALRAVLEKSRHAAPLVGELARGLSPEDHDLLRQLVLGVLRWKTALDAEIAGVSRVRLEKLAPNLREILEVALFQLRHLDRIPPYAAVSQAVDQARASGGEGAARLVNGVLRNILLLPAPQAPALPPSGGRGDGAAAAGLARHYSHPAFLVERWLARFGSERTVEILEADNVAPRLDLLTNPGRTSREALAAALVREGIPTEPSRAVPLALSVLAGNPLRSRLHAEGHFSVQDVGSQLLPLLLPEGEELVDLAAAPGGKTLSALAHGRARRVAAVDRSWRRLGRLVENTRRLGVAGARPVAADLAHLPLPAQRFDRVLLDAACSGTGTLRKNPEIRYRLRADAIERLAAAQEAALGAAAGLLAPGGYLLYSTCSLEEEENERVVARVLERFPQLAPAVIVPPDGLEGAVDGPRLRLFPDDRTDGFTAHLLMRVAASRRPAP
jgi:16S rRNA (cytosine967-C5)-methyltransferase